MNQKEMTILPHEPTAKTPLNNYPESHDSDQWKK